MSIKQRIVTTLLRLYPEAWRNEYGHELADMLFARPLALRTIADVLSSALRQRVRVAEPSTFLGLAAMLMVLTGLVWNIAAGPSSAATGFPALLQESSKTLPTVIVPPLEPETSMFYVLLLVGCGFWTQLRHDGTRSRAGLAAAKTHFIASVPVTLVGALMLLGAVGVVVVGPEGTSRAFSTHAVAYTYYNSHHHELSPWGVLSASAFRLPAAWLWGMVGGYLARGALRVFKKPSSCASSASR